MRTDRKAWGVVQHCHHNPEVDLLHIKAGGYSSLHIHRDKDNGFLLVSGAIDILMYDCPDHNQCRTIQLRKPGDYFVARAMVRHKFVCVEDATVVEVYTVSKEPVPSDIEREDTNGRLTQPEMAEYLAQREDR